MASDETNEAAPVAVVVGRGVVEVAVAVVDGAATGEAGTTRNLAPEARTWGEREERRSELGLAFR